LKEFFARHRQCAEIEQWRQGEDETTSFLKDALKKIKK
jgi:hypothetical protein